MKRKKTAMRRYRRDHLHKKFNTGYDKGYDLGYRRGYDLGFEKGISGAADLFVGTSIVIPTYNQLEFLKECIHSIQKYTPEPNEIIIIDNGSTDGTDQYLKSLSGKIRYKIFKENLGFAGGVNQGLMMATGNTLLFLNNDTIVTTNWLSNLQACLQSNETFGLVGPVTNYIGGDQLIETTYQSLDEMAIFASSFNRSDPERWTKTGRLTGFCVLMRREFFQRLGYLDEGFEIGNCEDDDYGLRARLMGSDLIIARDTFIHHAGSKTIKAFTPSQFDQFYGKNKQFYSNKWGDTHALLTEVLDGQDGAPLQMKDFYPTHVLVKGAGSATFWVENGVRYPLEEPAEFVSTRLSQVDLRNWPVGFTLSNDQVKQKLLSLTTSTEGALSDGVLVRTPEGKSYQFKQGKLHRFVTDWALTTWNLDNRHIIPISDAEKNKYAEGIPIIAPPIIRANNL
ncbi:glycosyltransferase family 2 protein [Paenibacillus sp. J2TS4]|uniref:glycosyltransferase family 2 protein n=1 Tax=Paenibacillus sp. J2TS4 TaxID=2807194 RepID=UPI001B18BD93|nr:glycosyltransferase family 2 protein [Paenibacillus sp. J2TS4]GIP31291.1 hypothetical protein J2TS4_05010 [Paenibacillus sp. J2TS4]